MKREEKNKKKYSFVPPEFREEYEEAMKETRYEKATKEYEKYNEGFKKRSERFRETVRMMNEKGPLGDKNVKRSNCELSKSDKRKDKKLELEKAIDKFIKQNFHIKEKIVKKINKIDNNFEIIYKDKKDGRFYKSEISKKELLNMDFEQETK